MFINNIEASNKKITQALGLVGAASSNLEKLLVRMSPDDRWMRREALAYGLATFYHETMHTFAPITERGSVAYFRKYEGTSKLGKRLGNVRPGDGFRFRGRGFVQITGRDNYKRFSELLEMDLTLDPDLTLEFPIAYEIATKGMSEGLFTGKGLKSFFSRGVDYVGAREVVNDHDCDLKIADYAKIIEIALV